MPLYARLFKSAHGSVNWILHDEGIAHPLIVVTGLELENFLADIVRQRQYAKEAEKTQLRALKELLSSPEDK